MQSIELAERHRDKRSVCVNTYIVLLKSSAVDDSLCFHCNYLSNKFLSNVLMILNLFE